MTRLVRTALLVFLVAAVLILAVRALGSYVVSNRVHANETSVVIGLRTLARAAERYHVQHQGYAASLQDLVTNDEGYAKGFAIDPIFSGNKADYHIVYEAPSSSTGKRERYFVRAVPYGSNVNGFEFCMDETGVIRFTMNGSNCVATSPPLQMEYGEPVVPYVYHF